MQTLATVHETFYHFQYICIFTQTLYKRIHIFCKRIHIKIIATYITIILKKCNSEYETVIHEALLIKKRGPKLNKQVYASGASFLLDIFKIIIIL